MLDGLPLPTPEPIVLPTDALLARQAGARLIARFEGFSAFPYQDQRGIWTIGYGTTRIAGRPVTRFTAPITRGMALHLLQLELGTDAAAVDKAVKVYATVAQRAACYSLTYNIGIDGFQSSSVLGMMNAGNFPQAGQDFLLWDKITDPTTGQLVFDQGLFNRRSIEKAVFLGQLVA